GPRIPITIDTESVGGKYCVAAIKSTVDVERHLDGMRQELDARFNQCTLAVSFVKELQHALVSLH
ncbi:hypothetical protein GGI04_001176, partial [Coemansia thaxteri]